jgi:hypothetical protein
MDVLLFLLHINSVNHLCINLSFITSILYAFNGLFMFQITG